MSERDLRIGDKLPTGETFMGYTTEGIPLWGAPADLEENQRLQAERPRHPWFDDGQDPPPDETSHDILQEALEIISQRATDEEVRRIAIKALVLAEAQEKGGP